MLGVRFTTLVSFLPSRSVIPNRLPFPRRCCFPFLFLSRPSATARTCPSIDKGEGPFVAKKFGYFATFHVDKLRLAQ